MIYCDTSLIVSALTAEVASDAARDWLEAQTAPLAISSWTLVEVASALSMKKMRGALTDTSRGSVEGLWHDMQAAMRLLPVSDRLIRKAIGPVDSPPCGLRAGDALHVAIAQDAGCELVTLDRNMAEVAKLLGLKVHPVRYPAP